MYYSACMIKGLLVWYAAFLCNPVSQPGPPGKLVDTVVCRTAPDQTYALYIPQKGNKIALPVVFFFDPHGDGALPLRKYQTLADADGFILVGSNNSRNGNDWATTAKIWDHLSRDVYERLKIDRNWIYTCGFSGGAKVAGYLALTVPGIRGVIANGAGLPDGTSAGDLPFSFTAIAGEGDMNMTDLLAFSAELDHTRTRHRVLLFDGIHEWAPLPTMREAFTGLRLDAMQTGLLPIDRAEIDLYTSGSKKRLALFEHGGQWVNAFRECRFSISLLEGWAAADWFKQRAASIASNPVYLRQRQAQDNLLIREQNTKAGYAQHFQDRNDRYWTTIIHDLQIRAAGRTEERPMDRRLLAYLSLAFYSFSNHLINANENGTARFYVELYKMADPANSETWYLSAVLDVREGNTRSAEDDLHKAVDSGFKDARRFKEQAEFRSLRLPSR